MTDDSATTAEELDDDPQEETVEEQPGETGRNTQESPQPTEDWKSRYENLQPAYTRTTQRLRELEDQLLREREQRGKGPVDDTDPLAAERERLERDREAFRLEREEQEFRRSYAASPDLLDAYDTLDRAMRLDPSPRGRMTAMLAAIQVLADKAQAQPAPRPKPAPAPPVERKQRVDTSRSDAPEPDATKRDRAGDGRDSLISVIRSRMGSPERK